MRKGTKNVDKSSTAPLFESNMVWGPVGLAIGAVFVAISGMKYDARWLLVFAWALLTIAAWWLARRTNEPMLVTGLVSIIVAIALYWLSLQIYSKIEAPTGPKQTLSQSTVDPTVAPAPTPKVSTATKRAPPAHTEKKGFEPSKDTQKATPVAQVGPTESCSANAGICNQNSPNYGSQTVISDTQIPPQITFQQHEVDALPDGRKRTEVRFSVDRAFSSPAFAASCDDDCTFAGANIAAGGVFAMGPMLHGSKPNIVGVSFSMPNPVLAGYPLVMWVVAPLGKSAPVITAMYPIRSDQIRMEP